MAEETKEAVETVEVIKTDLEAIHTAVHNLYCLSIALDLQVVYQSLKEGYTSPLTVMAEEALTKVNAYLESVESDEEKS